MAYTCNPSVGQVETGVSEFKATQSYLRPCIKKNRLTEVSKYYFGICYLDEYSKVCVPGW